MSHVYSSIQAELLELHTIFIKDIPNFSYNISDEFIGVHMKPYVEWRDNFKRKLIKYNQGIINTEKQQEIIHLLIFVEYCCNYYINEVADHSFLLEIIQTYPTAMNYTFHSIVNTYYPVVNLLFNYCFHHSIRIWPTKLTHILYPMLQNDHCDMFVRIYYLLDNQADREQLFRFLSDLTFSKCNFMDTKYDFFMKNIFRIPRIHQQFIEYMDTTYVKPNHMHNQIYTSYFINTHKNLYFMFIWMEKQMIRFILKEKRCDIYYAYYLLHLYLYKDCLTSFITHLSNLKDAIHKYDIKIFKESHCWDWMFQIIIDLQAEFPNTFRKNKDNTRKIEYLYNFFNIYCNHKYYIYSYYDSKLAWIIPYPNNEKLIRSIYYDLKENAVEENYERFFIDIVRYGSYNLVMNAWYFISSHYIKYFKISQSGYYYQTYIGLNEDDIFTLAIMNKDKRVLEFICERYDRSEVTIHTICKCFYNLFIFYKNCYNWKKTNLLRECKRKIMILIEHFYFKDIWLAFLLGYFFYSTTFKTKINDIKYLRLWILEKCIQIEKQQKRIKNVITSSDYDTYIWINDYQYNDCIMNNKYKRYIKEYAETVFSQKMNDSQLFQYKDIIVYMFLNDIHNFIKTEQTEQIEQIEQTDQTENECIFTPNIKEKIVDVFKIYQGVSEYMVSIFTKIMKLFLNNVSNNKHMEIDDKIIRQFKKVTLLLLELLRQNNIQQKDTVFYVIHKLGYLTNLEVLDWCIRQGMVFHNTRFWETEVKHYPSIVFTESVYYKWNIVAKVFKKYIFKYRLKKNNISKQIMHIELLNRHMTNSIHLLNDFIYNDELGEDIYHPRHLTKNEALDLLNDSTWVSPKLDGTRVVLHASELEDKHPKLLSSTKEILQYYYFVAEKIFYKSRNIYCIYEVWKKKPNRELTEFEMYGFYKLLGIQQNKLTESHLTMLLDSDKTKDIWVMKPFYYAYKGIDGVLRWQYIYNQYNFMPNDGLIIKNRKNRKYKMKPIHQMTIDLQIKNSNGYDQENNKYLMDSDTYALDYENKIVQCLFDKENNRWKIQKIRFDKKRPNPRHIIQKIEEIYEDPYWFYSLLT